MTDFDREGSEATFQNLAALYAAYVRDDESGQALAQVFVLGAMLIERETPEVAAAWREGFAPFVRDCDRFAATEREPEGDLN